MNIEIQGTGRAAGALGLSFVGAGHSITAVCGRNEAARSGLEALLDPVGGRPDLRVIAVSDGAIADVARRLAAGEAVPTVHTSGATSVRVLDAIGERGVPVGSLHPLQTLPDAERGAAAISGAWFAITAGPELGATLEELVRSIGGIPFELDDEAKPQYHAAATAASNYTNAALDLAARLFASAGVPFAAAEPLVTATVENAFDVGPAEVRTGPVARGDHGTIDTQKRSASAAGIVVGRAFDDMTSAALTLANDPSGGEER